MPDLYPFKVSDETENSKGLIVVTSGIKLERFLKNPVMFYDHNRDNVIGKWHNLTVKDKEVFADAEFDTEDEQAKKIEGKVKRGFVKGGSLGLHPLKFHFDEELNAIVLTESELKEISVCGIPSNYNSIALYDDEGKVLSEDEFIRLNDDLIIKNHNLLNMKKALLFAKVLNLAETCTEDDVLLSVQKLLDEKASNLAEITRLKGIVELAEKQKIIALVDGAISANKILAGEKEDYLKLAAADYETTSKLLAAKTPHTSVTQMLNGKAPQSDDAKKDWTFDDYHQKDPKALELLKSQNPDKYKELYTAKFGK